MSVYLLTVVYIEQICRSSLLSGRNERWPRRMLHDVESRWVCRRDRQKDRRTDRRTDVIPLHYAFR